MLDQPQRPWSVSDATEFYNVDRWGRRLFQIDDEGFLTVFAKSSPAGAPNSSTKGLRLLDVIEHCQSVPLAPPMIVRFPGIIQQRIAQINRAFQSAINSYGFQGNYRLFYPVKVNQQFHCTDGRTGGRRIDWLGVAACHPKNECQQPKS